MNKIFRPKNLKKLLIEWEFVEELNKIRKRTIRNLKKLSIQEIAKKE